MYHPMYTCKAYLISTFLSIGSVTETTSIFQYDTELSHNDFNHPEFLPLFIDEFSEEKRNRSKVVCGGSENQACVFDFLATGDKSLAISSGSEASTSKLAAKTIGNLHKIKLFKQLL